MSAYGTKLAEGFSNKLSKEMYDKSLLSAITNSEYEGEINAVGSKLNILNFDRLSEKTYANSALTADDITENNAQLVIDQYKSFYWKEKTLARWLSYIKNPHATIVDQVVNERLRNMDTFALGFYGDVAAGNRVGTDVTGTLTSIAATTGIVTSAGTEFTEDMEGRGFKAVGHDVWYRIKTYTDSSHVVIEDDKDDATSAYTGGAIGAVEFTVEAADVLQISTSNLLQYVSTLKQKLDVADRNSKSTVPDTDRFLIVPPEFETMLVRASGVVLHVPEAYQELVKRGFITELQGFKVFKSNRLTGNNSDGFRVLAGHPNWMTFAEKTLAARMEEDLTGDFGTAYKDLFVYGAKVIDSRRHFAAEGFWKF